MKTWTCKIGEHDFDQHGADSPMRDAVTEAYRKVTGQEPVFVFSGWGGELTEIERAVVENREPQTPTDHREEAGVLFANKSNCYAGTGEQQVMPIAAMTVDRFKEIVAPLLERIAELEKLAGKGDHPEDICRVCKGRNMSWHAPNQLFNKVTGDSATILCPICFGIKAREMGLVVHAVVDLLGRGLNEREGEIAQLTHEKRELQAQLTDLRRKGELYELLERANKADDMELQEIEKMHDGIHEYLALYLVGTIDLPAAITHIRELVGGKE